MKDIAKDVVEDFGLVVLPKHIEAKVEECLARMLELKTGLMWGVAYRWTSITPSGQAAAAFAAHGYTKSKHQKGRRKYATNFLVMLPKLVEDTETSASRAIADADKSIRELLKSEEARGAA